MTVIDAHAVIQALGLPDSCRGCDLAGYRQTRQLLAAG